MKFLYIFTSILLLFSCEKINDKLIGQQIELKSGKKITIVRVQHIVLRDGEFDQLIYYTKIPLENTSELRKEVKEVFEYFRTKVENTNTKLFSLQAALIKKRVPGVNVSKGKSFIFKRISQKEWKLL